MNSDLFRGTVHLYFRAGGGTQPSQPDWYYGSYKLTAYTNNGASGDPIWGRDRQSSHLFAWSAVPLVAATQANRSRVVNGLGHGLVNGDTLCECVGGMNRPYN